MEGGWAKRSTASNWWRVGSFHGSSRARGISVHTESTHSGHLAALPPVAFTWVVGRVLPLVRPDGCCRGRQTKSPSFQTDASLGFTG
jgi:hypothetical protein